MTEGAGTGSLVGQTFHEYRIERLLAQGGMGAVYLLRHAQFPNIRKVLKVILPEYARRADIRERFQCEADAMSQLGTHPNIVGIDNVSVMADGQLCMLIPFVDGKPLDEFVRDHGGKLVPHRTMHVITHVARALHHAHACGIVHRDLKPSNIFVEPTDNDPNFCKVLDFGIAKRMNPSQGLPSRTQSGPMGTPNYMAVEQYERAADATAAADVYALACMTWELVTGGLPWGTIDDTAVIYRRKLQDPPDPPLGNSLFPEWEAILRSALAVDPLERPTLRQLMLALASALPAIRPHVPSGVEILRNGARKLFEGSGPDDETVRSPSNRTPAPSWPPQATRQPAMPAGLGPPVPLPAHGSNPPLPTTGHQPPFGMPPAAPALAVAALGATTLGASSGAVAPRASRPARWRLVMLGLVAVVLAGAGTFALVSGRGTAGTPQPAIAARPTTPPATSAAVTTTPAITTTPPATTTRSTATEPPSDAAAPDAAPPIDAHPRDASVEESPVPLATRPHRSSSQRVEPRTPPPNPGLTTTRKGTKLDGSAGGDTFNPNAIGGD